MEEINVGDDPKEASSGNYESLTELNVKKPKKIPRKVIHCSDGVYEEYSTDEEELEERNKREEEEKKWQLIDPKTLTWIPWIRYLAWFTGSSTLAVCDRWGEKLAWWLGITSRKYYYEIQEYKRMKKEEEERSSRQDAEMAGWRDVTGGSEELRTDPPKAGSSVQLDPATLPGEISAREK